MKAAVIYASTTGNTEAMANAISEAVKASGAEVVFATADSADKTAVAACDVILLGSPQMRVPCVQKNPLWFTLHPKTQILHSARSGLRLL